MQIQIEADLAPARAQIAQLVAAGFFDAVPDGLLKEVGGLLHHFGLNVRVTARRGAASSAGKHVIRLGLVGAGIGESFTPAVSALK